MLLKNWLARFQVPSRHSSVTRRRSLFSFAHAVEQIEQRLMLAATTFGQYPGTWGNDGPIVQMNGMFYFAYQRDDTGMELFKSDGTPGGTSLVKNLENPEGNTGSWPEYLTVVNNTLFFVAYTNGNGSRLYKTDGTEGGTVVLSTATDARLVTKIGNKVLFVAQGPGVGSELYVSDGTTGGTGLVKDIFPGTSSSEIKAIADLNGVAIFVAKDASNSVDVWRSDGTEAGTYAIKALGASTPSTQKYYGVQNGKLYFKLNGTSYSTDGTEIGTISEATPISLNTDLEYTPGAPNTYFYTSGQSLYYFNGSNTVTLRTAPAGEFQANLEYANGYLCFAAKNENGIELWRSDGTIGGTAMLKDIRTGSTSSGAYSSYPSNLKAIGNTVYFSANDGVNGFELWKTDGTVDGTVLVKNMAPGSLSSHPARMTEFNGQLVLGTFEGNSSGGVAFWKSDGTTNGTVMFAGNHAPEMTNTGNPIFNPINQDIPAANNSGTLVKDMLASLTSTGGSITDFDAGALQGIAIVGVNNTSGLWQYSINNGSTWLPIQSASNDPKVLAADNMTRIRYQPNPGTSGTVGITFHAWDRSAFANGGNGFLNTGRYFSMSTVSENAFITVNSTAAKQATFGAFRNGDFFLDANRNRQWNGTSGGDSYFGFAAANDVPIAGDWNGDGKTDIGVFRNGSFYLDANGNRAWNGTAGGDYLFGFGNPTDKPLAGDWNGDGKTDIGIWRNGVFYLDANGNRQWDGTAGGDWQFGFGSVNDIPVTGDWNGDGIFDIGVYRGGTYYLDANGSRVWEGPANGDVYFGFAAATDIPVTGDWNGDGITDIGAYRNGTFYIDLNGNRKWDNTTNGDAIHGFAAATDVPLVGTWGPQNVSQPSTPPQSVAALASTISNKKRDRKE